MTLKNQVKNVYGVGLNNVGSYQTSGKPFVTASTVADGNEKHIEFPEVSNNITVKLDSAGGTNYNSLQFSGSNRLLTQNPVYSSQNNEYMWTLWVSSSVEFLTSTFTNLALVGFEFNSLGGAVYKSSISGKSYSFTFNFIDDGSTTQAHPRIAAFPKGWVFIAAGVERINSLRIRGSIRVYYDHTFSDNGSITQTGIDSGNYYLEVSATKTATTSMEIVNYEQQAKIGERSTYSTPGEYHMRDIILWDGRPSNSDLLTFYNNRNYYDFSGYTSIGKKVWLNPDSESLGSIDSGEVITNFGTTGGNFTRDDSYFNVGEILVVSGDAPFADVGGSGGELRVHYRPKGYNNVTTGKHYWTLDSQNESITMNVKSKELYLSADGGDCDYSVEAELTNIPSSRMFQHTGSGVDE
jgi:hypothetical protein